MIKLCDKKIVQVVALAIMFAFTRRCLCNRIKKDFCIL